MRSGAVTPAMLALCVGLSVVGIAARASASDCGPPRELVPLPGAVFPSTGQILDICYYYRFPDGRPLPEPLCGLPVLEDSEGRPIELFEERQIRWVPDGVRVARVITAYRPASPLAPGRYRVSAMQFETRQSNQFSVVDGVATTPALPVLSTVDFRAGYGILGAAMVFGFEPFDGSLAVERDGLVREPLESIDISDAEKGEHGAREFWLANTACQVNFPELGYGVSTTLRFGVLDFYGNFSGWTEPQLYTFPGSEQEYLAQEAAAKEAAREAAAREAADRTPAAGCSLSIVQRTPLLSGNWLLALSAFAGRRLIRQRRRQQLITSPG